MIDMSRALTRQDIGMIRNTLRTNLSSDVVGEQGDPQEHVMWLCSVRLSRTNKQLSTAQQALIKERVVRCLASSSCDHQCKVKTSMNFKSSLVVGKGWYPSSAPNTQMKPFTDLTDGIIRSLVQPDMTERRCESCDAPCIASKELSAIHLPDLLIVCSAGEDQEIPYDLDMNVGPDARYSLIGIGFRYAIPHSTPHYLCNVLLPVKNKGMIKPKWYACDDMNSQIRSVQNPKLAPIHGAIPRIWYYIRMDVRPDNVVDMSAFGMDASREYDVPMFHSLDPEE